MVKSSELSHIGSDGASRMVDVGEKRVSSRSATAHAVMYMEPATLLAIIDGNGPKGEVLAVARVAGIQAAKATSSLIPMCHPIVISGCQIEFVSADASVGQRALKAVTGAIDHTAAAGHGPGKSTLEVIATVRCMDRTGVEMEAMTAVSIAAMTVYDMVKAIDRGIVVDDVCLLRKTGGKHGNYERV